MSYYLKQEFPEEAVKLELDKKYEFLLKMLKPLREKAKKTANTFRKIMSYLGVSVFYINDLIRNKKVYFVSYIKDGTLFAIEKNNISGIKSEINKYKKKNPDFFSFLIKNQTKPNFLVNRYRSELKRIEKKITKTQIEIKELESHFV